MPRVDIGDVQKAKEIKVINCGYPRGIDRFEFGKELGRGGFGVVRVVNDKLTGKEYACKSIVKRLDVPNMSVSKQAAYLDNVKREIAVLRRLQGTLNVVQFFGAFEDDEHIHAVMEYCRGGELHNRIGRRHYSERVASSYMRGVLRTLAQCHSLRILHRDIKAGNFMLLNDDEGAPLKAIDFGLAVFFDPDDLPRTDLGLEGTPWFMAPEVLSSNVLPASDIWAAGILAYQLLSGQLPFDDPKASLPKIWKAILTQEPSFGGSSWNEISPEAKSFVQALLHKEPEKRPTAREALQHPWLALGGDEDRRKGKPLAKTVIQRIQRFQQGNAVSRTIFELIAQELLNMLPQAPSSETSSAHGTPSSGSLHNGTMLSPREEGSLRMASRQGSGSGLYSALRGTLLSRLRRRNESQALLQGPGGGAVEGPPLLDRLSGSAHGGLEYYRARGESAHGGQTYLANENRSESVHGGGNYWRIMRAAAAAAAWRSGHGDSSIDHLRHTAKMSAQERAEQRKAARLALDTSAHRGTDFKQFCDQLSADFSESHQYLHKTRNGSDKSPGPVPGGTPPGLPIPGRSTHASPRRPLLPTPEPPNEERRRSLEEKGRGQCAFHEYLESTGQPGSRQGHRVEGRRHSESSSRGEPQTSPREHRPRSTSAEFPRSSAAIPMARGHAEDSSAHRRVHPSSVYEDEDLPTIVEASPRTETTLGNSMSQQNLLGSSFGSQQSYGSSLLDSSLHGRERRLGSSSSQSHLLRDSSGHGSDRGASLLAAAHGNGSLHGNGSNHGGKPQLMSELRDIMRRVNFTREGEAITAEALAEGLQHLGYRLDPSEVRMLTDRMRRGEQDIIPKSAFLASQLDWAKLLQNHREMWLEAAQRVFEGLEGGLEGRLSSEKLMNLLRAKLPAAEVDYALEDALLEAGYANEEELDFEGFLRLLQSHREEELDQYDARLPRPPHAMSGQLIGSKGS